MTIEEKEMIKTGDYCYVKIVYGSPCDSPIVSKDEDIFKFYSYGSNFTNVRDWSGLGNYGCSGSYGKTSDINILFNSLFSFNKIKGRVGLVTKEVYNDLKNSNYSNRVIEVNFGFE